MTDHASDPELVHDELVPDELVHDVALVLDCRDMLCPMPVIELARHHTDVEVGQVLAVLATDVAARVDVPAWCRMKGHEYLGADTTTGQVPRYLVRRSS